MPKQSYELKRGNHQKQKYSFSVSGNFIGKPVSLQKQICPVMGYSSRYAKIVG